MTGAFIPADPGVVLAALPAPVATFDAQGRWSGLNEAAELWLNLSERGVAGLSADDPALIARLRVEPELGPLVAQAAQAGESVLHPRVRFEISDRAGRWTARRAGLDLAPLPDGGVVALIRPEPEAEVDASPRRAARSAIGMAEMLAHEIKNPLAGIRGAAQLLSENLGPEDRELTDLIVAESRRIVALLEEVERFGDTTLPQLRPVNVHDILDRARRSMALGGAAPKIVADYDPSLPPALVDPGRIMQVVLNLLRNAAEALAREARAPDDPRGPALIRLRTAYDRDVRGPHGTALPLQVEVEDNGPGVPEAIADQIFEPFVSGRENGTGLGLALVGKIVTEHGGLIRVDSRPGRTLFRVSLPLAGKGAAPWTEPY
ncbi:two-component system sensor histidine kinase NtrB [Paracoccus salipaludis]|uniref:histidine kinase n=1 Tax=Paracoccus salipaludis TaxID=2032623 RepID=A0A2A2GMQ8_9RHOB|nr:ATP-binding protein [Paracoccus salipaludis]PAU98125.1 PAS domain-containing sensor histidine kinase [Paracoccus salipaludis]